MLARAQIVRIILLSSWVISPAPGTQPFPAPILPYPLQKKPRGASKSPAPSKSRFTPVNDEVGGNPGLQSKEGRDGDAVRLGNACGACVRLWMLPKLPSLAITDANQSAKAGLRPGAAAALLL